MAKRSINEKGDGVRSGRPGVESSRMILKWVQEKRRDAPAVERCQCSSCSTGRDGLDAPLTPVPSQVRPTPPNVEVARDGTWVQGGVPA